MGAPAARSGPWALVGRDEELDLLEVESRAGPVVVAGPAGVGKTRLIADWVARSERATVDVVATHSSASVPFGAFAPWLPGNPGASQDHLATLGELARRIGALRPATIVVDDGHLLDDASAALVLQLARHGSAPVVVTVRSGVPCPDPVTALWKDGVGTRIDLKPLSEAECATLLRRRLGGRVHSATEARLWTLSAGNPMYLREVTEAALEQGQLTEHDGLWAWVGELAGSPRLSDLVRARVGRTAEADRAALELLALGEPLPVAMAVDLLSTTQIAHLEAAGLLAVSTYAGAELAGLAHPLYGEVLRAEIPVLTLRAHHRALATAALAHGFDRRDPLRVAQWLLSGGGSPAGADLLVSASHRALVLQDYDLAVRLAAAAVESGGGTGALLAQARALGLRGDHTEMAVVLEEAAGAALTPAQVAEVAQMRVITSFWRDRGSTAAEPVLDEALARLAPVDGASVAATATCAALLDLDLARAHRLARLVQDAGAELGPMVTARTVEVWAAVLEGRPSVLDEHFGQLAPLALEHLGTDPVPAAFLSIAHSVGAVLTGRIGRAERLFAGLADRDIGSGTADRLFLATPLLLLAQLALASGRVRTGAERALRALELMGEDRPYLFARPVAAAGTAAAAAAQAGDAAGAAAVLDRISARTDRWVPEVRAVLDLGRAWAAAARGCTHEATDLALGSAEDLRASGAHGLEVLALLEATRLGGADGAVARLEVLARSVEGPLVGASASLARALASRDGAALDRASAELEGAGAVLVAAEAAARAVPAHAAHGLRRAAATSRRRAMELAERCESAVTPLLASIGHPSVDDLTEREREVALLVAAGSTNRTAAQSLGVSLRTVNSHLNHAYAKLGTSDRQDLARILGRPGPPPDRSR